ncbi:MAG: alpha/beta hydrolase fold domain-containing protein [Clostridia bacterium]|nr:alpha/beta hydrolase fold domain-containing protein [Clostridia bacterium]MBQ7296676.1 alpha/beta hydrolase fold domain-containing protein [Clostridia bacterium]
MQSITGRVFMSFLRFVFHSPLNDSTKLSDNAAKITKKKESNYKPSKEFTHTRHKCGQAHYEVLKSIKSKSDKVILLIHGGGFKVELIDYYRKLAEKYSRLFDGATIVNADYRTWPSCELPNQMYDTVGVYLELLSKGIKSENITVIGDSAGATLALTSALWLRDNNYTLPGHTVCFSLWGDATSSGESKIKNAYTDPFYGISKKEKIEDNMHLLRRISKYVQNADREDPYISPCFGEFHGFNKVTLFCGTAELDESDNDRVYMKMKQSDVDVRLFKYEGMCHCFQMFSFLPESKDAFNKMVKRDKGEI